ncbi:MAG: hypothetical protein H6967_07275 [Chromatiaceae bacterium]|nr:hypothetical protein [Chromatiaceae bacterium]
MYSEFGVDADIRAVEKLDYRDPITLRAIALLVYWKITVGSCGATEVWSVMLPKSAAQQCDECGAADMNELRSVEFDARSCARWNIDFQSQNGIIVSAKSRNDLLDAIVDCRECIGQMAGGVCCAA